MSEPQIKKTDRDSKYLGQWFREKYTNSEIISIWKIGNKKQKQKCYAHGNKWFHNSQNDDGWELALFMFHHSLALPKLSRVERRTDVTYF